MKSRKIYYFLLAGILAVALFLFLKPKQEIAREQTVETILDQEQELQDSEPEDPRDDLDTSEAQDE